MQYKYLETNQLSVHSQHQQIKSGQFAAQVSTHASNSLQYGTIINSHSLILSFSHFLILSLSLTQFQRTKYHSHYQAWQNFTPFGPDQSMVSRCTAG